MSKTSPDVNGGGAYAPISNVSLAGQALERAQSRSPMLPGIVCLYGPSGYGKTQAAAYCSNRFKGIYVECRSFFKPKTLMTALAKEAGLRPEHTVSGIHDQLVEELALSQRPLIIDEVDHIVATQTLQVIRDLHDASGCAVLIIGEEDLYRKLMKIERFHNRVLAWQPAVPASATDVKLLARCYAPGIDVADDLLHAIHDKSRHVVRRICVNLDGVREFAGAQGLKKVDLAAWGNRGFYTGDKPERGAA